VVVHWVSGHVSVKGNERADELAKGAVQEIGARRGKMASKPPAGTPVNRGGSNDPAQPILAALQRLHTEISHRKLDPPTLNRTRNLISPILVEYGLPRSLLTTAPRPTLLTRLAEAAAGPESSLAKAEDNPHQPAESRPCAPGLKHSTWESPEPGSERVLHETRGDALNRAPEAVANAAVSHSLPGASVSPPSLDSLGLSGVVGTMQELKSSISTLSTRLSTLETAVTNRFAALPLDSEGPPPPQLRTGNPPARPSYAQAVSSMPAILPDAHRAAPEAPAPFEIPPLRTAPVSASTAFVLRLAALRADHAFRSIEPRRVLAALRNVVSGLVAPEALLRCDRLASGDLRIITRSAVAVTALTKAVEAAYSGTVLESPVWRRSLVLHYVPVTVEEGEVVSAIEDALERDEGASGVTAARWLTRERGGKTVGSYVVEMGCEEDVSKLVALRHLAIRHGTIHVDMVWAHSPEERAAARAAPHRGHPVSSTPHPEPAARLLSPPPSAPQEPTREPTRYGELGSGNLLSMTPTVIASPPVESSAMVMVTPSPAPLSPLKSPRRLPSARFDDESGGESEDEAEGNASWSDEVEEAIEATNQSELERKKEMEKEESEPKTEKGESEERRKSAGEKASEKLRERRQRQLASRKKTAPAASSDDELLMRTAPAPSQNRPALRPRDVNTRK
jgi:hypothetical protein